MSKLTRNIHAGEYVKISTISWNGKIPIDFELNTLTVGKIYKVLGQHDKTEFIIKDDRGERIKVLESGSGVINGGNFIKVPAVQCVEDVPGEDIMNPLFREGRYYLIEKDNPDMSLIAVVNDDDVFDYIGSAVSSFRRVS